jgi:hypothetical protein
MQKTSRVLMIVHVDVSLNEAYSKPYAEGLWECTASILRQRLRLTKTHANSPSSSHNEITKRGDLQQRRSLISPPTTSRGLQL